MKRKFQTNYGEVTVKDCMVDLDDGIEVISKDCGIHFELIGFSAENMYTEKLEHLIESELS